MKKKLLISALILSTTLGLSSFTGYADDDPNAKLQEENKADTKKIEEIHKNVDKKNKEIDAAEEEIVKISEKITALSEKIAESETKLQKLKKELSKIEKELDQLVKKEEKTKNDMKLRIQYMYENSSTNLIVLLLKENSFADFLSGAEYKSKITSYDRDKLDEYKKIKEEINKKKKAQADIVKNQTTIQEKLANDKSESENLIEKQKELIANNKSDISNLNEEISELQKSIEGRNEQIQANIAKAQAELEALRAQQAEGNNVINVPSDNVAASSGYIWPLPSNYTTITSPFSSGRRLVAADYVNGGHLGVDIGAPTGTPIYAARSGIVVWATFDAVSGNMVCILQDDGRIARYAHMSSIGTSLNKTVMQGEVIGYVGMTGSATGPHLHFQVETDPNAPFGSTAFNPLILY